MRQEGILLQKPQKKIKFFFKISFFSITRSHGPFNPLENFSFRFFPGICATQPGKVTGPAKPALGGESL